MRRDLDNDPIYQLIARTCQYPPDSLERQRGLTRVVQAIIRSGKLWRDSSPEYDDALQQTWLYLCRNLCEATTAKSPYDATRSSVITWLDRYLKQRLEDLRRQSYQQRTIASLDAEKAPTPAAPSPIPPILEEVKEWARTDPNGELCRTHIKGHPEVNCQTLILRRLPPRSSWEELSKEFGVPITTLNSFYRRQCFPRLRQFGEHQGYL
ncbi:MAG: sigma-70 family RNA polymerase sigma factor [Microcoleaceae cyanobacterium]